jgi:hypothetical protein
MIEILAGVIIATVAYLSIGLVVIIWEGIKNDR